MSHHTSIRTFLLCLATAGVALYGASVDNDDRKGKDGPGEGPDPAELTARLKAHHPELFKKLDTDHDDKLSKEEMQAGREKLQKLREEKKQNPAEMAARLKENHPELFKQLDTNQNGELSKEEMEAGREKLRELKEKHGDKPGKKPAQGEPGEHNERNDMPRPRQD
jgi:hypothetical protein